MAEKKIFDIAPAPNERKQSATTPPAPTGRMLKEQAPESSATQPTLSVHRAPVINPAPSPASAVVETTPSTNTMPAPRDTSPPAPASPTVVVDDKQLPPQATQQVPKIFDTTKYQLPIQKRSRASSGWFMLQFIMLCLVVFVIIVVIAIDAGWLDIGFELPFDLL